MTTLPEAPRSALVDARTGALTREWVRFFEDLRRAIISSLDEAVAGRLEALEYDALFPGAGETAAGAAPNDAELRGRVAALEVEALFPAGGSGAEAVDALEALLAAVRAQAEAAALEDALAVDPCGRMARELARLSARVDALEPVLATEAGASLVTESGRALAL